MSAMQEILATPKMGFVDTTGDSDLDQIGARLPLIPHIERGFGVVPVLEDGAVLLRQGEVAVYREERPTDLVPGLYCLERQRPVARSPLPDSLREIEREVVYVRPARRGGGWEYQSLRSQIIGGARRYSRPEGPIYDWALPELLLGPVVGIYAPSAIAGER